jgi:hypothetical protein
MSKEANIVECDAVDARGRVAIWSIGMYTGESPLDLKPVPGLTNPVLCAEDCSDIDADFVADPFMIRAGDTWHMFFEVMNAQSGKGEIGLASSADGMRWSYQQVVLKEPFHLSYPDVFCVDREYYMIPESYEAKSIRLYRGDEFPHRWSPVTTMLEGAWVDPSIFCFEGRWWMFASPYSEDNDALHLFYADSVRGPWRSHPMNPIVENNGAIARPAGRVVVLGDRIIRFTQDCYDYYGKLVRAFEVSELTTSSYCERESDRSPVLSGGDQLWRRSGMHHVDPHFVDGRWLACVDGWWHESRPGDDSE